MGGILQAVAEILHFPPGVVSFTTCKGNDNGVILQDFRHNLQECALSAFFRVTRPARRGLPLSCNGARLELPPFVAA